MSSLPDLGSTTTAAPLDPRGKKKGEKFRALKAKEAAKKAARQAQEAGAPAVAAQAEASPVATQEKESQPVNVRGPSFITS